MEIQAVPVGPNPMDQSSSSYPHASYAAQGRPTVAAAPSRMPPRNEKHDLGEGCIGCVIVGFCWFLVIITFPFSLIMCFKVVQQYERAIIFRLGRTKKGVGSNGCFFILPCIDTFVKIDTRSSVVDIPPQQVLTKDSVTIEVNGVLHYRISQPMLSVVNVWDSHRCVWLLAQSTLRNVIGTKYLTQILSEKDEINSAMALMLDDVTSRWGITAERLEIKDVILPAELKRAMAAEAEATREAKAKVVSAEGEKQAARSLKEAADIMLESPAALQIRYLQTLTTIAAEYNNTIVFPLPVDLMMKSFFNVDPYKHKTKS